MKNGDENDFLNEFVGNVVIYRKLDKPGPHRCENSQQDGQKDGRVKVLSIRAGKPKHALQERQTETRFIGRGTQATGSI